MRISQALIAALKEHPGATSVELAARLQLSRGAAARTMSRLYAIDRVLVIECVAPVRRGRPAHRWAVAPDEPKPEPSNPAQGLADWVADCRRTSPESQ